jgi:hypothetical protein
MKCPRCGLLSPDTAIQCDCGHDFRTGLPREPTVPAPPRADAEPFVSAAPRAQWVIRLLIAGIVLDAVAGVSGVLQVSLAQSVLGGATVTADEVATNDSRQQLIGVVQVALYVATAVAFLAWLHRAYRNLSALTRFPRTYAPGWVIGAFFVPFLNLVRPFRIVRETWHLSDPDAPDGSTSPVVGWWWGTWLVAGVLGQAALRLGLSIQTPQDALTTSYVSIAADVASLIAAVFAIRVVRGIDARQTATRLRLAGTSEVRPR